MDAALTLAGMAGTGLLLGFRHAFDADHVAAVSAIVSRSGGLRGASKVGAYWGLGHASTLLAVGALIAVAKIAVPKSVAAAFELPAGIALVALGVKTIIDLRKDRLHVHAHEHGLIRHVHAHSHASSRSHAHMHLPFAVGAMHGLAGSAALALLAAAAGPPERALAFMAIFGTGSLAGILAATMLMSVPLFFAGKFMKCRAALTAAAGGASFLFGCAVMARTGNALLTSLYA